MLGLTALELAGRELARRSLLHALIGRTPSVTAIVIVAVLTAIAAVIVSRGKPASLPVLGALFTIGLALQLQLGARLQSDGFYYFAYLRSIAFDRDVNFMNDPLIVNATAAAARCAGKNERVNRYANQQPSRP